MNNNVLPLYYYRITNECQLNDNRTTNLLSVPKLVSIINS